MLHKWNSRKLAALILGIAYNVWVIARPGLLAHFPGAEHLILAADGLIALYIGGQAHVDAQAAKIGNPPP